MSRTRAQAGQATVEVVAAIPLVVAVVFAVVHVLAAGAAGEAAAAAAEAGAAAMIQDGDPRQAATQALGPAPRGRTTIEVSGRRVTVSVRPGTPIAPLARLLTATERADAGPGPAAASSTTVLLGDGPDRAQPERAR
jgi:hypothetical protein